VVHLLFKSLGDTSSRFKVVQLLFVQHKCVQYIQKWRIPILPLLFAFQECSNKVNCITI